MAELLLLLLALAVIGHPARLVLARITSLVGHLDTLQSFLLDIYLGGLLLYLLALLPFGLFTAPGTIALLAICFVISAILFLRRTWLKGLPLIALWNRLKTSLRYNAFGSLAPAATVGLFLLILWVVFEPTKHFIFGSIHDTSLHALFTQVIIDNGHIPSTLAPYEPSGIVQPIGPHPIFAFATYLFGWSPPLAVFYVTPLFISLLVLGGYFLGRCITSERSFGFFLAATLGLVASHPVYMTWGGNSFAVAFPWLLVGLGFLVLLMRTEKIEIRDFWPLFLIFGYLMALHISAYLAFLLIGALCCLVNRMISQASFRKLKIYLVTNLAGALLIAPFLYRYLAWRTEVGHNVGLPDDVVGEWLVTKVTLVPPISWIVEQISPYLVLQVLTWLLLTVGMVILIAKWRTLKGVLIPLILAVGLIPIFLTWLATRSDSVNEVVGATTATIGYVGLSLPVAYLLRSIYRRRWAGPKWLAMSSPLIGLLLVALILSPYLYYRAEQDPGTMKGNYNAYAVTTEDDLQLIEWIKDSLSPEAMILTNAFEPGMFIPSLAQRKIVFPYTASQNSVSYKELVSSLHDGCLTPTVYQTMKQFGVTHLYIGSQASYWPSGDKKWYPRFFLDNPNFGLVQRFGDAYVFAVLYKDPNMVFADDFEHEVLDQDGWRYSVPDGIEQNGRDDVLISSNGAFHGVNSLELIAQKHAGDFYWTSLTKVVYLGDRFLDGSHVRLSFYLHPAAGFGPYDNLMLVVSDAEWQQQVYFEAVPGALWGREVVSLSDTTGLQEFDLSQIWYEIHGSPLPNAFHLQLINFDTDGVTNVGYVDYITISRDS